MNLPSMPIGGSGGVLPGDAAWPFDLIAEFVAVLELNGSIVRPNAEWQRVLGWPAAELAGRSALDFVHPEDVAIANAELTRLQGACDRIQGVILRISSRNGVYRWLSFNIRRHGDHLYTSARDITQEQLTQAALRRREKQLDWVQAGAEFGTWEMQWPRGNTYLNEPQNRIMGHDGLQDLGDFSLWRECLLPQDAERFETVVREHLMDRRSAIGERLRMRNAAGELRWIALRGGCVEFDDSGTCSLMAGTYADITTIVEAEAERDALTRQVGQMQRMDAIGRLAGGVAHDFNNLLTVIRTYMELLLEENPTQPIATILEDVREVVAATRHGSSLTRQLLAFSRRQTLQPEMLDLTEVVEAMLPMLLRLIGEDVRVEFAPGDRACRIHADRGQIEQVLLNLASNAREAMPNGGRVRLSTGVVETLAMSQLISVAPQASGPWACLSLHDNGTGITPDVRERLFEPFFTTKESGTGLGLATVYGIVHQSGGAVAVASEPGYGTEFKVYLPQAPVPAAAVVAAAAARPTVRPEVPAAVLLVEDDDTLRRVVARILERHGYDVVAAATPAIALRLVQDDGLRPDVVVSDMVMPDMNGRELVERLRAFLPSVPALIVSGYSDNAQVETGIATGAFRFLAKPFTPEELLAAVRRTLA